MILIGQYDSPFVRRVGIALILYGFAFEHRPWSVFGDADLLQAVNPLTRVPTLVLDDGVALTDSHMILDYLDSLVPTDVAMFPRAEPARHVALRVAALAAGAAEKAVSLFYERRLHDVVSDLWVQRCTSQIKAVLTTLEADLTTRPGPFWGDRIGHCDIAIACALRFIAEAHGTGIDLAPYPRLTALAAMLEATAPFMRASQPFLPPA